MSVVKKNTVILLFVTCVNGFVRPALPRSLVLFETVSSGWSQSLDPPAPVSCMLGLRACRVQGQGWGFAVCGWVLKEAGGKGLCVLEATSHKA